MTNSVALTASNFTLSTAQAPEGNRNNISEGESKTSSCSKKRLRSSGEADLVARSIRRAPGPLGDKAGRIW